jgi:aspartate beta-hydroxylase
MTKPRDRYCLNKIYDHAVDLLRRLYGRRISGPPVLDAVEHFADAARFRAAWRGLREEARAIAGDLGAVPRFHELMAQQTAISGADGRDWRVLVVKAYGVRIARNAERCPRLAALLAESPEVLSATLSFLAPHKHLPEHRGPFRGVIRYYLGLSVPPDLDGRPGTVLRIDGRDHRLADGQGLLWDDTYPHEVWNATGEVRIALLLDVRRRGMPADLELLTRFLILLAAIAVRLRRIG